MRPTCLILEDGYETLQIIKFFMKDFDCDLKLASNLDDAEYYFFESRPDFMLIDINIGLKGNGLRWVEKIRTRESVIMPIVVLTASREPEDYKLAMELKVDEYILKPIDVVSFKKKIASIMELVKSYSHLKLTNHTDIDRLNVRRFTEKHRAPR